MRRDTKEKIIRLASHLFGTRGLEICEVANFISIATAESNKIGLGLHYRTIEKWETTLIKMIRDLVNNTEEAEVVEEVVEAPYPVKIKIMFSDGSSKFFIPEPPAELHQPQNEEEIPEIEYTGLFNYRRNGDIIIRRGSYKGCNIKSYGDIIKFFGNPTMAFGWANYQISPDILHKITPTEHTELDIETLKKLSKYLLKKLV